MFHKLFMRFRLRRSAGKRPEDKKESSFIPTCEKEGDFQDMWKEKQYMLSYLYLYEIITCEEGDHLWQHVLMIDGDDENLVKMVDGFVTRVRYLTIVTKHPEWYMDSCDRIYRECGMLLELQLIPRKELSPIGARIYTEKMGQKHLVWSSHVSCPESGAVMPSSCVERECGNKVDNTERVVYNNSDNV